MTRLIDLPLDLLVHITECIPDARSRHSFYTAFPQVHHLTVAACISSSLTVTPMLHDGQAFVATRRLQQFPPPCKLKKLIIIDNEPCKYNAWCASMVSLFLPEAPRASAALSTLEEVQIEGLNPPEASTEDDQQVIVSALAGSCPQLTFLCLPDTESYGWLLEQLAICTKDGTLSPLRLTRLHLRATCRREDGLSSSAISAISSLQDLTITSQNTRSLEGLSSLQMLRRFELENQGNYQSLEGLDEMLQECSHLETLFLGSLRLCNYSMIPSIILYSVSSSLRILCLNTIHWEDEYEGLAHVITSSLPNCQKISACRLFVSCEAMEGVTFSKFCMLDDAMAKIASAAKLLASKQWECKVVEVEGFLVDDLDGYLDGIWPLVCNVNSFILTSVDFENLLLPNELVCKLYNARHLTLKSCYLKDEMTFEPVLHMVARLPHLRQLEVHELSFMQNEQEGQGKNWYIQKVPVLPCVAPYALLSHSLQNLHLSRFTIVRGFLTSIAYIFPCVHSIELSKCEILGMPDPCPVIDFDPNSWGQKKTVKQSHACLKKEAQSAFPQLRSFSLYNCKTSSSSG